MINISPLSSCFHRNRTVARYNHGGTHHRVIFGEAPRFFTLNHARSSPVVSRRRKKSRQIISTSRGKLAREYPLFTSSSKARWLFFHLERISLCALYAISARSSGPAWASINSNHRPFPRFYPLYDSGTIQRVASGKMHIRQVREESF